MRTHKLKTWPGPFQAVLAGEKNFEIRRDDRAYAVDDVLVLQEYDPSKEHAFLYTGREIRKVVTYRCGTGEWIEGAFGWVVLSLADEATP